MHVTDKELNEALRVLGLTEERLNSLDTLAEHLLFTEDDNEVYTFLDEGLQLLTESEKHALIARLIANVRQRANRLDV